MFTIRFCSLYFPHGGESLSHCKTAVIISPQLFIKTAILELQNIAFWGYKVSKSLPLSLISFFKNNSCQQVIVLSHICESTPINHFCLQQSYIMKLLWSWNKPNSPLLFSEDWESLCIILFVWMYEPLVSQGLVLHLAMLLVCTLYTRNVSYKWETLRCLSISDRFSYERIKCTSGVLTP